MGSVNASAVASPTSGPFAIPMIRSSVTFEKIIVPALCLGEVKPGWRKWQWAITFSRSRRFNLIPWGDFG